MLKSGYHIIHGYTTAAMMLCLGFSSSLLADTEGLPVINSNEVLDSPYRSSTFHRVENVGYNNGFYLFNVESDFGRYEIVSRALLKRRVDELKTLGEAITQFERDNQQLSQELRSELSVSATSAMDIITSPFSTASQLAGQLRDNLGDTLAGENPFVEEYAARYSYVESEDPTTAQHKRNVAYQLKLDLYSTNYRVQSFLNSIANARSAGRVSAGVGVGHGFFNTARQSVLDQSIRLTLKTKTLDELNRYQRELLNNLGVNVLVADAFMQQPFLTPSNRTVILYYLNQIKQVDNLDELIEMTTTSENEIMTLVFERLCKALYFYYNRVEKFSSYINFENQPAVLTAENDIVFFEHKDLLVWSDDNQTKYQALAAASLEAGYAHPRLVSLGTLTQKSGERLADLGFQPRPEFLSDY